MRLIIGLLLIVLTVACSTTSVPSVQRTYAPQVDFSQLKSFSWQLGGSSDRYQKTLRSIVQRELEAKGVSYTEMTSDFLVAVSIAVEKKTLVIEDDSTLKPGLRSSSAEALVFQVNEGGLAINFYASESGQQIFQGIARTEINDTLSAAKRKEQLVKAVVKILDDFPPAK